VTALAGLDKVAASRTVTATRRFIGALNFEDRPLAMTILIRTTVIACLLLSAAGFASGGAYGEGGGPPIARWRVHAKGLERLPQARSPAFMAKYTAAGQFTPEKVVILNMVVRGIDLATAARVVGMESRIGDLEQMLRREQRAGEVRLTGKGPATKLVPIWPPPGYHHKKGVKAKKGE
jgi:hypothetical protein